MIKQGKEETRIRGYMKLIMNKKIRKFVDGCEAGVRPFETIISEMTKRERKLVKKDHIL